MMVDVNSLMAETLKMHTTVQDAADSANQSGDKLIKHFKAVTIAGALHLSKLETCRDTTFRYGAFFVRAADLCGNILLPESTELFDNLSATVCFVGKREVNDLITELRRVKMELTQKPDTVERFHHFSEQLDLASSHALDWHDTADRINKWYDVMLSHSMPVDSEDRATWHLVEPEIRNTEARQSKLLTSRPFLSKWLASKIWI